MKKILFAFLMVCNFAIAQETNYYSLFKDGKKYPKLVRYVWLDKSSKVNSKAGEITFYVGGQKFKYSSKKHKIDTCNYSVIDKMKIVSVSQLSKDEFNEVKRRLKEYNIKKVIFLEHYNSKVSILEKLANDKVIVYGVDWIYAEICSF